MIEALHSVHAGLRWRAADVLATVVQVRSPLAARPRAARSRAAAPQNNPVAQKFAMETAVLVWLLHMLESDAEPQVRVKALLADRRIELEFSEEARELLADKGYDPHYGARPLKRVIQRMKSNLRALKEARGFTPKND